MDEIMIGIDFMKIGWVVAVPLIVTCIITYGAQYKGLSQLRDRRRCAAVNV